VQNPDKDGFRKLAKSLTKEEFADMLEAIINAAYAAWPADGTWKEVVFVFDNPSFHAIDDITLDRFKLGGRLRDVKEQLQHPPRYSGDFMQCIEHVHGSLCSAWRTSRLMLGTSNDFATNDCQAQRFFRETVSRESVTKNIKRLTKLLEYLVEADTGGWAPRSIS
jgi:hypothetical protein